MKLHQSRTAARIDIFSPRKCQFLGVHISALAHHTMLHLQSFSWLLRHSYEEKNLPKAQRTQGIEHFDSINTFSSSLEILVKLRLHCQWVASQHLHQPESHQPSLNEISQSIPRQGKAIIGLGSNEDINTSTTSWSIDTSKNSPMLSLFFPRDEWRLMFLYHFKPCFALVPAWVWILAISFTRMSRQAKNPPHMASLQLIQWIFPFQFAFSNRTTYSM